MTMKQIHTGWLKPLALTVTALGLVMGLLGCKELNNNPPPADESPQVRIDLQSIQRQLGFGEISPSSTSTEKPLFGFSTQDDAVTTPAKSLLIGALAVTRRSTPYTNDIAINRSLTSFFGSDLTDSGDFLRLITLPTSADTIEFKVPPSSAGHWQVLAIAFETQPKLISNLSDTEHENAAIYYGITDKFLSADDIGETPIALKLKRVCLLESPPKGCASFAKSLTGTPIVTASVEIVGIKVNGTEFTSSLVNLPIMVRNDAEVSYANTQLATIRDEIREQLTVSTLTVQATHTENPLESEACRALTGVDNQNEYTNVRLKTHCEVSDYTATY